MLKSYEEAWEDKNYYLAQAKKEKDIKLYLQENVINQFVAFWLATNYNLGILYNQSLKLQFDAVLTDFSELKSKDINQEKVKRILKNNYHLKIINDEPLDVEVIKNK